MDRLPMDRLMEQALLLDLETGADGAVHKIGALLVGPGGAAGLTAEPVASAGQGDYAFVRDTVAEPVADCRLPARVLREQFDELVRRATESPAETELLRCPCDR